MSLNSRQSQILKAIIEDFIEYAQPVASVELVERRHIPLSGATVRNIMSDLVRKGYLKMVHVSSGRLPTELAYRYYISELMEEPEISVLEELALKQMVWNNRYELERLLRSSCVALADATSLLSVALNDDGFIFYSGASKILEDSEFYELNVTKSVFRLLDDYNLAKSVFDKVDNPQGVIVLIGREIGLAHMETLSIVYVSKVIDGKKCYLGIVGPARLKYQKVIPVIRYMSHLLDEINDTL